MAYKKIDKYKGLFWIYVLHCSGNGKRYVGLTGRDPWSRFVSHCKKAATCDNMYLYGAINKYGANSFVIEVVDTCIGLLRAQELEQKYIAEYGTMKPHGMNLCLGGGGSWGHTVSEESRKIIGEKGIGRSWTPEQRAYREKMYAEGRWTSRGMVFGDDHKARLSAIHKARIAREVAEHGEALSMQYLRRAHENSKGIPCSEDRRKRVSEANAGENNGMYGVKHSAEAREKIAEASRDIANRIGLLLDGVTYKSMVDCSKITGMSVRMLQRKVRDGEAEILYRTTPRLPRRPKGCGYGKPLEIAGVTYASRKEAKEKLGLSQRDLEHAMNNKVSVHKTPVTIHGVEYKSKAEACRALNVGYVAVDRYLETGSFKKRSAK